jgi:Cytidylate kinase-like family
MPIVTISRMYGSGGSHVAQRVADALEWDLLDNGVVDAVAERLGLTRAEVSAREERVPSLVERLASALTLSVPEMLPVADTTLPLTEERIVAVTKAVIEEAVQTGNAVVVGRGAQCLLANRPDALHVFCYA